MGCCHQRLELTDSSAPKANNHQNIEVEVEECTEKEAFEAIHEHIASNKIKPILSFVNSNTLLQNPDQFEFEPLPSTIGCLCIAIIENKLKFLEPSTVSLFTSILPTLISNLSTNDNSLIHYSCKLIDSSSTFLPESVVLQIVRQGIFEKLLNVKNTNTAVLGYKLYKNRERAQRIFLKNKGMFIICLCLIDYPEQTDEILQAALELVAVRKI